MTTRKPARPAPARQAAHRADAPEGGKILPPRDPVDVPRQPPRPDASTPDEAAKDSRPVRDNRDDSNWADGSKPRPHAKNTRTHLL
ncbi:MULTISPECIES: hypothetical protein [Bordetella]|uniref:Uncharacterized protein n=1 Tax=Bordetella genomosp. 2 TaxID=1983456 RepID=A0A261VQL1_9BORD|nr:hypothetical protein [Bordetella genomosp. 2]OZI75782.1 hypothetical protein CAL24_11240 [Bordetella genomosp. 2]